MEDLVVLLVCLMVTIMLLMIGDVIARWIFR